MSVKPNNPTRADAFRSVLSWWDESGVDIPDIKPVSQKHRIAATQQIPQRRSATKPAAIALTPAPSVDGTHQALITSAKAIAAAAPTLEALKTAIEAFDAGDLAANASRAVFARGNSEATIMVIGEAPGAQEDKTGQPFVGQAGQLLDKMLASIGLSEQTAYITNVCNWRPITGRTPSPQEIELCHPFITRHIELAAPQHILLVGGVALEAMSGIRGIMKNRGQWQSLSIGGKDIPALPLYHPAFLLRRPELKREAWHDLLTFSELIKP